MASIISRRVAKGLAVFAGSSAGLAIQSEFVFTAINVRVDGCRASMCLFDRHSICRVESQVKRRWMIRCDQILIDRRFNLIVLPTT
jgi:cyanophycinase-like exopeptidase